MNEEVIAPTNSPIPLTIDIDEKIISDNYGELQLKGVLIFDEIRTGFRVTIGGAQKHYNVTPHLATFGKAMANGYAIGAVTGRADIMKMAEKEVFISSTFSHSYPP